MEITVTTTTKKLTKSLLNQIPSAKVAELIQFADDESTKMGVIRGVFNEATECALLCFGDNRYAILPLNWEINGKSVSRKIIRGNKQVGRVNKKFADDNEREAWVRAYQKIKNQPSQQIYI